MLAGLFGPFLLCVPHAQPGHSAERMFIVKKCHAPLITLHPLSHCSTSYQETISSFCIWLFFWGFFSNIFFSLSGNNMLCQEPLLAQAAGILGIQKWSRSYITNNN